MKEALGLALMLPSTRRALRKDGGVFCTVLRKQLKVTLSVDRLTEGPEEPCSTMLLRPGVLEYLTVKLKLLGENEFVCLSLAQSTQLANEERGTRRAVEQ